MFNGSLSHDEHPNAHALDRSMLLMHAHAGADAMAQNDPVVRVYHTKQPTPAQLLSQEVAVWPDDYALAAILPPLDGSSEAILEQAFEHTQLCNPEASKVQWAGERRRSTSPGDVVVLGNGQAYRCAFSGWDPLALPPPGFWTAQVARCRSALARVLG